MKLKEGEVLQVKSDTLMHDLFNSSDMNAIEWVVMQILECSYEDIHGKVSVGNVRLTRTNKKEKNKQVYCRDRVQNLPEESADVIVLGSGAAGIMAAITVAQQGLKCVVLEKGTDSSASNAAKAGGPALADTKLQEKEEATVTVEQLYGHMYRFTRGTVNAGLLHHALEKGKDVEQIFSNCGIEMELLPDTYGVGFRARHLFKCFGKNRWQPLVDYLESQNGRVYFKQCGKFEVIEIMTD
mgnify:CR=1 FL=1